ncbi:arsenate reductase [Shimia gijangensis]|uniref:Arsenate reductase n=1 Tax=Shimia gijangensis TaxID=1470563 RepID=A0A1M6PF50_9RHOB|nr:arsenate reductase (glutaredoxin) [Shimia gijangensis]SHK06588.1 arsenate reductase [Shimia gijangensis]
MITIWHNPRCSKSRQTLALVEEKGAVEVVKYLEAKLSESDITAVRDLLGMKAIDMMRPKEPEFSALGLSKSDDDKTLISAMAKCPKLIERPIVIAGNKAAIGRPPEAVLEIL